MSTTTKSRKLVAVGSAGGDLNPLTGRATIVLHWICLWGKLWLSLTAPVDTDHG